MQHGIHICIMGARASYVVEGCTGGGGGAC